VERRSCRVRVDPFSISIGPGQRLEQIEIQVNGSTVYDFRTDVSNPPAGSYAPKLPSAGFAARCKAGYVATVRAKDTGDAALQTIGESAPFVCPTNAACAPVPSDACIGAAKARFDVSEAKPGKERLTVSLSALSEQTDPADFGDPVAGDTLYDLCVYDGTGALAGSLSVERAGALCGPAQAPCWKARKKGRLDYKDPDGASEGVSKIGFVPGAAGKGRITLSASNHEKKGRIALPVGIAGELANETSAIVQLHARGAACFSAELGTVKKADGVQFKARAP
jgi:hypothetical protein